MATQLPGAEVEVGLGERERLGEVIAHGGFFYRPLSNASGISHWG